MKYKYGRNEQAAGITLPEHIRKGVVNYSTDNKKWAMGVNGMWRMS